MNDIFVFRQVADNYHAMLDAVFLSIYTAIMNTGLQIEFVPTKLREAREQAFPDLSLSHVAKQLLGIKPQRLSAYELGLDNPTPTMLAKMCALYKVELVNDLTKQAA